MAGENEKPDVHLVETPDTLPLPSAKDVSLRISDRNEETLIGKGAPMDLPKFITASNAPFGVARFRPDPAALMALRWESKPVTIGGAFASVVLVLAATVDVATLFMMVMLRIDFSYSRESFTTFTQHKETRYG